VKYPIKRCLPGKKREAARETGPSDGKPVTTGFSGGASLVPLVSLEIIQSRAM